MASLYPTALDTLATNKSNATVSETDHPQHHNDLADAVNKIEAELGVNPSGLSASVAERLDAIPEQVWGESGGNATYDGSVTIGGSDDVTQLIVRGAADQVENFTEWHDDADVMKLGVTPDGWLRSAGGIFGSSFGYQAEVGSWRSLHGLWSNLLGSFAMDTTGGVQVGNIGPGGEAGIRFRNPLFSPDASLWRTGPDALNTPGTFTAAGLESTAGFRLGITATAGHVLTTDASGNGTWQAPTGGGGGSAQWQFDAIQTTLYEPVSGTVTGFLLGDDTDLFRDGSNIWRTTGTFNADESVGSYRFYADSGDNLVVVGGGGIAFGDPYDAQIYRSSAGVLTLDASATINGQMVANFGVVAWNSNGAKKVELGDLGPSAQAGIQLATDTLIYRDAAGVFKTAGTINAVTALQVNGTAVALTTDARLTDTRTPTDATVTDAKVASGAAIAESKLALASDAAAGTASRRTLGTGATQAAAGNDARLTDTRTPTDSSVTDAKVASGAAIAESKLALASDAAAGTASRRTLGTGATQAAAGNDSRLSDTRTPTAHAASHASGGGDPVTLAQSQVTNLTTDLAAKASQANADSFNAIYRYTLDSSGFLAGSSAIATRGIGQGAMVVSGTNGTGAANTIYLDPAEFPAIGGKTAQLRIRAVLATNATAPGNGTFTFGLHSVTVAGATGGITHTLAAATATATALGGSGGSALTASTRYTTTSADFAVPAAGYYTLGLANSGALAAAAYIVVSAFLQVHYV